VSPPEYERHPSVSLVTLIHLARTGCPRALDRLVREVEGPIYRYLLGRLRAAPDAEDLARDLCQETLIRAVASIARGTFASDARLLSWGLTIARNVLLDHLRQARGRAEVRGDAHWAHVAAAGSLPGEEAPPPRPLETFAAEALAQVPESTAELLRLRLVGGRTWSEVARALGISESAAKRRFQRAQAALRRQILARVDALPSEDRRSASLQRLPGGADRMDGAVFRSPGTEHGPGSRHHLPPRPPRTPE
jgi:RNA polymerase sigma-70 factor (ECF subfamily)